jgi:sterol desaturase/sphingolipid hydroxylase (fatty acid hydroxylase superfamily)
MSSGSARPRLYVSNSRESVRLFERGWMEALSKVHWSVPLILFGPCVLALLAYAVWSEGVAPGRVALWFAAGLLGWTLAEYLLHRFVFHFHPRSAWGRRLHFIFHGVHHDYPSDGRRLVMPPAASIPIALAFYALFRWCLPASGLHGFTAGFMSGYVVYDSLHYALHHAVFRHPLLKALKRHHMLHHFADPAHGFGVSSPLWDLLLGTRRRASPPAS